MSHGKPNEDLLFFIMSHASVEFPDWDTKRSHYFGPVEDKGSHAWFFCPCKFGVGIRYSSHEEECDPFAGRTPSVAELEQWMARDLKVMYKPLPKSPKAVELNARTFEVNEGYRKNYLIQVYLGQCGDCGMVLFACCKPVQTCCHNFNNARKVCSKCGKREIDS